jgi:hypothetical protein
LSKRPNVVFSLRHFSRMLLEFEASVGREPLIPAGAALDHVPGRQMA